MGIFFDTMHRFVEGAAVNREYQEQSFFYYVIFDALRDKYISIEVKLRDQTESFYF